MARPLLAAAAAALCAIVCAAPSPAAAAPLPPTAAPDSEGEAEGAPLPLRAPRALQTNAALANLYGNFLTWSPVGAALATSGSAATLTTGTSQANALWSPVKIDTRASFAASFTLAVMGSGGADGMSFGFHNDPRGFSAVGGGGGNVGLFGGLAPWVGISIWDYNSPFQMWTGTVPTTTSPQGSRTNVGAVANPLVLTFAYDACAQSLTTSWSGTGYAPGQTTQALNLASYLGSGAAYMGFTGGTGGAAWTHLVSGFSLSVPQRTCAAGLFSYGGCTTACSPCAPGAVFVSAVLGCSPGSTSSSSSSGSPTDTTFYFSGDQLEGFASLSSPSSTLTGLTFAADRFGAANKALTFGGGFLSTPAASAIMTALPTGAAPVSVAAWLNCPSSTPTGTYMSAAEFGAPGAAATNGLAKFGLVVTSNSSAARGASAFYPSGGGKLLLLPVCDSTWHHVALVRDAGATTTAFVDGLVLGSAPAGLIGAYASELLFARSVVSGLGLWHWLDAGNAGALGDMASWPNLGSAPAVAPTTGGGYTAPVVMSNQWNALTGVVFQTTTTMNFPPLGPVIGPAVTGGNAIVFPFFISYAARMTGPTLRLFFGISGNQLFGFWGGNVGCLYSDTAGMGGWQSSSACSGAAGTGLWVHSLYCDVTKYCRMWLNGNLVMARSVVGNLQDRWGINTDGTAAPTERSAFVLFEFQYSSNVAYSDAQLAAVHRYHQIKYGFTATAWRGVVGLGYARTDVLPSGGSGGTLRLGGNGLGSEALAGTLGDVRVFSRALTGSEVMALASPPLNYPLAINPTYSISATSYSWTCAAGAFGPAATMTYSAATQLWTWAGGVQVNCQSCLPGTWSAGGAAACTGSPCAPGTFGPAGSTSAGAATCAQCVVGSYAPASGATACSQCPAGSFATSAGASSCSGCPLGTWSSSSGSSSSVCTPCVAGTYSVTPAASSAAACVSCPIGTASAAVGASNSSVCVQCAPGTIAASAGATSCSACAAGFYAASTGNSQCTACAPGTVSPSAGAQSAAACVACAAGYYSAAAGASLPCAQCPAGTYALSAGSAACTSCPPGTYSKQLAQSAYPCLSCAAGTFNPSAGSGADCTPCFAGTYSLSSGAASCLACPAGTASSAVGASSYPCAACPVGTYGALAGASTCTACGAGTFAASTGLTACAACAAGTFLAGLGANSSAACLPCAAGSFAQAAGSTACAQCPSGSYTPSTGQSACAGVACAAGLYGPAGRTTAAAATCTPCPVGTYAGFSGSTACYPCPPGTSQSVVGAVACVSALATLYSNFQNFAVMGSAVATSATTANLVPAALYAANAMWAPVKLDTRVSFSASFTISLSGSAGADGFTFGFHNDPRGLNAIGGSGGSVGLFYDTRGTSPGVAPWVGVAVFDYNTPFNLWAGTNTASGVPPIAGLRTSVGAAASPLTVSFAYDSCLKVINVTTAGTGYSAQTFASALDLRGFMGSDSVWVGFTGGSGGAYWNHLVSNFGVNVALPSCAYGTYSYGGCAPVCAPCATGDNFTVAGVCQPSSALTGGGPTDTAFWFSGDASETTNAFSATSLLSGISFVPNRFGAAASATLFGSAGGFLAVPASSTLMATLPDRTSAMTAAAHVKCAPAAAPAWSPSMGQFFNTPGQGQVWFTYYSQPNVKYYVTTCTGPCAAANACGTYVTLPNYIADARTLAAATFSCAVLGPVSSVLEFGQPGAFPQTGIDKFGLVVGNTAAAAQSSFSGGDVPFFPVCDSKWHHIALTRSATATLSAYVDGVLLGVAVTPPAASFNTELLYCRSVVAAMGLVHWLDAESAGVSTNGAAMSQWANLGSAPAVAPVAGTGFNAPVFTTGVAAGRPAVSFDTLTRMNLPPFPTGGLTNGAGANIVFPCLFTLVAQMKGTANNRAFEGQVVNQLFGFWGGRAGVFYSDTAAGWVSTSNGAAASGTALFVNTMYCDVARESDQPAISVKRAHPHSHFRTPPSLPTYTHRFVPDVGQRRAAVHHGHRGHPEPVGLQPKDDGAVQLFRLRVHVQLEQGLLEPAARGHAQLPRPQVRLRGRHRGLEQRRGPGLRAARGPAAAKFARRRRRRHAAHGRQRRGRRRLHGHARRGGRLAPRAHGRRGRGADHPAARLPEHARAQRLRERNDLQLLLPRGLLRPLRVAVAQQRRPQLVVARRHAAQLPALPAGHVERRGSHGLLAVPCGVVREPAWHHDARLQRPLQRRLLLPRRQLLRELDAVRLVGRLLPRRQLVAHRRPRRQLLDAAGRERLAAQRLRRLPRLPPVLERRPLPGHRPHRNVRGDADDAGRREPQRHPGVHGLHAQHHRLHLRRHAGARRDVGARLRRGGQPGPVRHVGLPDRPRAVGPGLSAAHGRLDAHQPHPVRRGLQCRRERVPQPGRRARRALRLELGRAANVLHHCRRRRRLAQAACHLALPGPHDSGARERDDQVRQRDRRLHLDADEHHLLLRQCQ